MNETNNVKILFCSRGRGKKKFTLKVLRIHLSDIIYFYVCIFWIFGLKKWRKMWDARKGLLFYRLYLNFLSTFGTTSFKSLLSFILQLFSSFGIYLFFFLLYAIQCQKKEFICQMLSYSFICLNPWKVTHLFLLLSKIINFSSF